MSLKEWFPHDYHASRDIKIMRLLRVQDDIGGAVGYGMYWHTVEMLHYMENCTVQDLADSLHIVLRVTSEQATRFVKMACDLNLLTIRVEDELEFVECERVQRNIQARTDLARKKRHAASKRWESVSIPVDKSADAGAMQVHTMCIPGAMLRQDKTGQDKKGKEKESTRTREARPCSSEEVFAYFAELGLPPSEGSRFQDYYTANGWRVGKNPMKDWKAAARNWRKGYEERHGSTNQNIVRTRPVGLPAQVVEIANRPKMSESDVEGFKRAYLSKVSPGE